MSGTLGGPAHGVAPSNEKGDDEPVPELHLAAVRGDADEVARLLAAHVDVHETSSGLTAFDLAVAVGNMPVACKLYEHDPTVCYDVLIALLLCFPDVSLASATLALVYGRGALAVSRMWDKLPQLLFFLNIAQSAGPMKVAWQLLCDAYRGAFRALVSFCWCLKNPTAVFRALLAAGAALGQTAVAALRAIIAYVRAAPHALLALLVTIRTSAGWVVFGLLAVFLSIVVYTVVTELAGRVIRARLPFRRSVVSAARLAWRYKEPVLWVACAMRYTFAATYLSVPLSPLDIMLREVMRLPFLFALQTSLRRLQTSQHKLIFFALLASLVIDAMLLKGMNGMHADTVGSRPRVLPMTLPEWALYTRHKFPSPHSLPLAVNNTGPEWEKLQAAAGPVLDAAARVAEDAGLFALSVSLLSPSPTMPDSINAFATPAGHMFFFPKLVRNASKAQLACIVGHETTHVLMAHVAESSFVSHFLGDMADDIICVATGMNCGVLGFFKDGWSFQTAPGRNGKPAQYNPWKAYKDWLLINPQSVENEFEADATGAFLAGAAGFDSAKCAAAFETGGLLASDDVAESKWTARMRSAGTTLATHPPHALRAAALRRSLAAMRANAVSRIALHPMSGAGIAGAPRVTERLFFFLLVAHALATSAAMALIMRADFQGTARSIPRSATFRRRTGADTRLLRELYRAFYNLPAIIAVTIPLADKAADWSNHGGIGGMIGGGALYVILVGYLVSNLSPVLNFVLLSAGLRLRQLERAFTREMALVEAPDAGNQPLSGPCAVCGVSCTKLCKGCHAVYYCGQACQRRSWPQHKTECRAKKD